MISSLEECLKTHSKFFRCRQAVTVGQVEFAKKLCSLGWRTITFCETATQLREGKGQLSEIYLRNYQMIDNQLYEAYLPPPVDIAVLSDSCLRGFSFHVWNPIITAVVSPSFNTAKFFMGIGHSLIGDFVDDNNNYVEIWQASMTE